MASRRGIEARSPAWQVQRGYNEDTNKYTKNYSILIGWEQCSSVLTPVQKTHRFDWLKDNRKFSKPMTSRKIMTKIFCGNFSRARENGSNKSRKVYSGHWRYNRRTTKWCENINTSKSTPFWLSVWKTWWEGKSIALEIEEHEPTELNRLLQKFYAEEKNKAGQDY